MSVGPSSKRVQFTNEQIAELRNDFTRPITKRMEAKKFDVSTDVLTRIMKENHISPYYKYELEETLDDKKTRIKLIYEETTLPMNKICRILRLDYAEVLSLLHEMYSDEEIEKRSKQEYSLSKQGDNNPTVQYKKKYGHSSTYKGGHPVDDGNGYNLVANEGVLDKSNTKAGNNTFVFEHQKVFLPSIGLHKMPKGFVIHHIDKNKKNNNLNNLALMTSSAHMKLHALELQMQKGSYSES